MSAQPAQLSIDTAFDRALTGANARERPPVPVGAVRFGQAFVRDCAPHELLMRAQGVAMVDDDEVAVVVIACTRFDQQADAPHPCGRVFGMPRAHTVRKVTILKPLVAEA